MAGIGMWLLIPFYWQLSTGQQLNSLVIDRHPCHAEQIKNQNRYICNAEGNVQCLTGWKERDYNPDPDYPCSEPICSPECVHGLCNLPGVCACDVGWDGLDCGSCISAPDCVHGSCFQPESPPNRNVTEGPQAFGCFCDHQWGGAKCEIPLCASCENGKCVDTAGDGDHVCQCFAGWKGPDCDMCTPIKGCLADDLHGTGCTNENGTGVPNECFCNEHWKGAFCEEPRCTEGGLGLKEIQCKYGECVAGGQAANGSVIAPFCRCNVGWKGEKCDECIPAPNCPTDIGSCSHPWECNCIGNRSTDNSPSNRYCCKWGPSNCDANTGRQSPIDIVTTSPNILTNLSCTNFDLSALSKLTGADRFDASGHWVNTGTTFKYVFDQNQDTDLQITSCDGSTYKLAETHFHWGSDNNVGSEHTFNGKRFPLEMHLVHANTDYALADAGNHEDGYLVIAFLFEGVVITAGTPYLGTVIGKYTKKAKDANQPVGFEFPSDFGIDLGNHLKNSGITTDSGPGKHFQYLGSLTTGDCNEAVTWVLAETPLQIDTRVLGYLRDLEDKDGNILQDNFREIQDLGDRSVYRVTA